MARGKKSEKKTAKNGANLGFEQTLWQAADKLRGNMDASDYKHVVLGLIFLKYISDAFEERHATLKSEPHANPEDRDEYAAENVFWVPKAARWPKLQAAAKQPGIGKLLDEAMLALEKDNPSLKGVLPKDYARESLDKRRLGELIDLIGTIGLGDKESRSKDILGRVYEYFLGQFAAAEGKKGERKKGGDVASAKALGKAIAERLFGAELQAWRQLTPALPFRDSPESWVEIYNRSSNAVDLTGWRLDEGIDYRFPAGKTIAVGGYLVVAKDVVYMQSLYPGLDVIGPFTNKLSKSSDYFVLKDPNNNLADEVRYFSGGHWPEYADGGGSSLELRDPRADNSKPEAWAASASLRLAAPCSNL